MLFTLRVPLRKILILAVLRSAEVSLTSASSFSLLSGLTGVIFLLGMMVVPSRSVRRLGTPLWTGLSGLSVA